ncbi:hypothetical protein GCHA_1093 [Paraglaciecola chathamensis S18K6]|uniref:Uncharacterized protein n=1 Tax=Paraglaciecola chathamensis S18K6 TaxID=1127672 RepID=A0AAV3UVP1_9ALTE|nr:hypothetical protein GCHA_1093 [Paraglaciecola chathamensis S18K6]
MKLSELRWLFTGLYQIFWHNYLKLKVRISRYARYPVRV